VQFATPYKPPILPGFNNFGNADINGVGGVGGVNGGVNVNVESDWHPHTNVLRLAADGGDATAATPVILLLQSTSKFLHPMHIHGHRFEVLQVYAPTKENACGVIGCERPTVFNSAGVRASLAARPVGSGVFKDTVVVPGGGAVAVRFTPDNKGVWHVACTIVLHQEEGMRFLIVEGEGDDNNSNSNNVDVTSIVNGGGLVGGVPSTSLPLPPSFPQCNDPARVNRYAEAPACECFFNKDEMFDYILDSNCK
jgi:hypothetical protein